MDEITGVHVLFGPLLLVLAILFKMFPPTSINHVYGYRTPRSMKNAEVWAEANRYSSTLLIVLSLVLMLGQGVLASFFDAATSLLAAAALTIMCMLLLIGLTEHHLSQLFDREGNRLR